MYNYPNSLEELIENLRKLPSVGRKSAQRMALHIVNMNKESVQDMVWALQSTMEKIKHCSKCGNLSESEICPICSDVSRDGSVICVVEDVTNLMTIENTDSFKGLYHVLKGLISPSSLLDSDEIGIDRLIERVNEGSVREIILAISPTVEGETTMLFIKELLKSKEIKITRIASGIPVGGNLEYFDDITLSKALEDRRDL